MLCTVSGYSTPKLQSSCSLSFELGPESMTLCSVFWAWLSPHRQLVASDFSRVKLLLSDIEKPICSRRMWPWTLSSLSPLTRHSLSVATGTGLDPGEIAITCHDMPCHDIIWWHYQEGSLFYMCRATALLCDICIDFDSHPRVLVH